MDTKNKFMMATSAIHKLGDISRNEPNICVIYNEDDENFIGNWVYGLGFVDVKFPKNTTRELTDDEVKYFNGRGIKLCSLMNPEADPSWSGKLSINFDKK